ncbi:sigma-70 family RNA polymerase sigma factor [Mesorhizobium sp.]|uniref:sigma-70 family RNA polymerase sigma factor n=1 Tax=Mesorhizobium sp. TaxID=1871066 RepID=UPI0025EEEAEC|nr:sigma-70 family RNA polymerase sigma factor [Mesorhizobium sp.]
MASYSALRRFAVSLTRDPTRADDLVQEAVVKAMEKWEQFTDGTNLKAWLFTILRNEHISQARKATRLVEDPDDMLAKNMSVQAGQPFAVDLKITQKRMRLLPTEQRRAIELVAVLGNDYERAAELIGVAVGTIKSRVSRARDFLETGIAPPEEPEPIPVLVLEESELCDRVSVLFRAGRWISQIAAEIGAEPRRVMRMVVDQKLRRA